MSSFISTFNALYRPNPFFTGLRFYDDAVRGQNLIAKATQLVNDLEAARTRPDFDALLGKTPDRAILNGPQSFEQLLEDIVGQLKKIDKPLTVLNFIEARTALSDSPEKDVDIKA